jgi:hypothetical protein
MSNNSLPKKLKPYFWDYSFSDLSLKSDRELIIRRILSSGSWDTIKWLRKQIGDVQLKNWIITKNGRGLTPNQLRFWELVLDLPHNKVNQWVKTARTSVWGQR